MRARPCVSAAVVCMCTEAGRMCVKVHNEEGGDEGGAGKAADPQAAAKEAVHLAWRRDAPEEERATWRRGRRTEGLLVLVGTVKRTRADSATTCGGSRNAAIRATP